MSDHAVALYRNPLAPAAADPISLRHPWRLWRKAIWFRANPRDTAYMQARLAEHFPEASFVDVDSDPDWPRKVDGATTVVLLYPDSIGLGFAGLESRARRLAPEAEFVVVNGRRRKFPFDSAARRRLYPRRFLEWTMLLEFFMGLGILIATPFLLVFDTVRGRS